MKTAVAIRAAMGIIRYAHIPFEAGVVEIRLTSIESGATRSCFSWINLVHSFEARRL